MRASDVTTDNLLSRLPMVWRYIARAKCAIRQINYGLNNNSLTTMRHFFQNGVILFCFLYFVPMAISTLHAQTNEEKVMTLILNGKRKQAQKLIKSVFEKAEEDYYLGLASESGVQAVKYFNKVIKKYPDSRVYSSALLKLGQYYLIRGYPGAAIIRFDKILAGPASPAIAEKARILKAYCLRPPSKTDESTHVESQREIDGADKHFTLQLGAFSIKNNAENLRDFLKLKGFSADVVADDIKGKKVFRVCVERFLNQEDAKAFAEKNSEIFKKNYRIFDLSSRKGNG